MDRSAINDVITTMYAAREANDAAAALACFAPTAEIRMAGSPSASAFAATARGAKDIKALLEQLTSVWQWQHCTPVNTLIDGQSAAVRYDLMTTHAPTGQVVETHVMDYIEFDGDGRIALFVAFVDTAMAERLAAAAGAIRAAD